MSYIALYREWRPQTFSDMVGQEHVTRTLQNALRTGRFAHAYLFSGPRGTGKTSAAKVLAKAINCEDGSTVEPCNECPSCRGITEGSVMDVVEIDAASNRGVDEIRNLRDQVKYAPTEVRHKVYIVDEVHMLTTEAFNALLKTLEEPPRHVMFILATTEPHRLPATIISRCQRFDFRRITGRQIVDRLHYIAGEKGIDCEDEAYWLVARAAEGGMRDALSIFDQAISFGGERITTTDIADMIGGLRTDALGTFGQYMVERKTAEALQLIGTVLDDGKDVAQLLHDVMQYFRDVLMYKTVPGLEEIRDRLEYDKTFTEVADRFTVPRLIAMIDLMTETQQELKWQSQSRLLLEMLIIRLCKAESADVSELVSRIEELERKVAEGIRVSEYVQGEVLAQEGTNQPTAGSKQPTVGSKTTPSTRSAPGTLKDQKTSGTPQDGKLFKKKMTSLDPDKLEQVKSKWQGILDEVKRRKIQAQAWLINGEPVGADDSHIVIAFKNDIHCETVKKPINKEVIDAVFSEQLQGQYQLFAIMQKEWLAMQSSSEETSEETVAKDDDFIHKLIDTFGEDKVEILD